MVVTQELREVVKQDKQHSQGSAVQSEKQSKSYYQGNKMTKSVILPVDRFGELCVPEEWRQELEERGEELRVHGPPLLLRRQREDAADEDAVRHDLEPGVREARSLLECAR